MAFAAQCNQVRIRSDGLFIKGKYSLAKIFVVNSHFAISACLNRDYCFSLFSFFFFGGGGGRIHAEPTSWACAARQVLLVSHRNASVS